MRKAGAAGFGGNEMSDIIDDKNYARIERLERELAEANALLTQYGLEREHNACQALAYKAERDEAQATAALVPMLNQRIQTIADQRDEARECLRLFSHDCHEVHHRPFEYHADTEACPVILRIRKAAGMDAPECPACKTSAKMIRRGDEWVCHGTHVRTNNLSNTPAHEPRKENHEN